MKPVVKPLAKPAPAPAAKILDAVKSSLVT